VTGAANVIGSALLVSGVLSRLIYALSGYGWPRLGSAALVAEQPVRWLVRRQIDHRGNLAAAGRPIAATVPVMPEGKDRRRRSHQALATYATERRTDRAAGPRLHRYPMNAADIGPTRIAVTLAAMSERIRRRHGLDIAACWELLPGDARDRLARESAQVAVRNQSMVWAAAALAWTGLFPVPWAAACWAAGQLVLLRMLYSGLGEAVESYCDLIEATVAIHRQRPYTAAGVPLPDSTAAEIAVGASGCRRTWPASSRRTCRCAGHRMPPRARQGSTKGSQRMAEPLCRNNAEPVSARVDQAAQGTGASADRAADIADFIFALQDSLARHPDPGDREALISSNEQLLDPLGRRCRMLPRSARSWERPCWTVPGTCPKPAVATPGRRSVILSCAWPPRCRAARPRYCWSVPSPTRTGSASTVTRHGMTRSISWFTMPGGPASWPPAATRRARHSGSPRYGCSTRAGPRPLRCCRISRRYPNCGGSFIAHNMTQEGIVMVILLRILLNTMLIGSMLTFVGFSVLAALADRNFVERLLRFGMLFSGGLVVLGAEAGGVNFSQFITTSLSSTGAFPAIAGVVVPGVAGVAIGLFLLQSAHNGSIYAIRIMIFVGMLAAAQFAEIYAHALNAQGLALGRTVAPNISFVVGVLLCLALTLDPRDPKKGLRILRRMRSGQPDDSAPAAEPSGARPEPDHWPR